jgi:hypothetical protein
MTCTIQPAPSQKHQYHHHPNHRRSLRCPQLRSPVRESTLPRLGLAAVFNEPDIGECVGTQHVFYPSNSITWLCLRQVGGFSHPRRMSDLGTKFDHTNGELLRGVPMLNFSNTRDDANALIAAKSRRVATAEQNAESALVRLRDQLNRHGQIITHPSPLSSRARWMPRPYLGYDFADLKNLVDRVRIGLLPDEASRRFFEALRRGLPLHMPVDVVYTGVCLTTFAGICAHHFREIASGRDYGVQLPRGAAIEARVGDSIAAQTCWCRAMPRTSSPGIFDYTAAVDTCGGRRIVDLLLRLWFANQSIRLPWQPDSSYFRSELVAPFMTDIPATSLAWDMASAEPYTIDEVAVFPPLMLSADESRLTLPGHVDVYASF